MLIFTTNYLHAGLVGYSFALLLQILKLLDQLNLAMYKEAFKREQIDGWLFAELNDEILEHELGITSRLHRIKLIRVIEGKLKVNCAK